MTQSAAPCEYDLLSIMQKVEVFEMSLKHTAGQDLYKVNVLALDNIGVRIVQLCFPDVFAGKSFDCREVTVFSRSGRISRLGPFFVAKKLFVVILRAQSLRSFVAKRKSCVIRGLVELSWPMWQCPVPRRRLL